MRIDVITLFPDEFHGLTGLGVTGRAISDGRVRLETWNPRDFATDRQRSVDDRPYGGGPGMVMRIGPLEKSIEAARAAAEEPATVSLLSPQGDVLNQAIISRLGQRDRLILVCGRYEGLDERLVERQVDEQWSIGDYVLSGGELAAAVLIDAVLRLQPGVLGDEQSAQQDSFSDGLLDCPHYTRPEDYAGHRVPEVLLTGDHGRIERWRRMQSLGRTWQYRPDLLAGMELSDSDRALLDQYREQLNNKDEAAGK